MIELDRTFGSDSDHDDDDADTKKTEVTKQATTPPKYWRLKVVGCLDIHYIDTMHSTLSKKRPLDTCPVIDDRSTYPSPQKQKW